MQGADCRRGWRERTLADGETMDLMPNAEQEAIAASVRAFLSDRMPIARVRALCGEGQPDAAAVAEMDAFWREAAAMGFFGLSVAEADGGAGYDLTGEMILFEELGRALAPGPWLGSVLAAGALALAGGAAEVVARRNAVLGGELRVALVEGSGQDCLVADKHGFLEGEITAVPDAPLANAFLVADARGVFLVDAHDPAVLVEPRPSLDVTRPIASVAFRGAPALQLARDASELRRRAVVLACAEAVGSVQRTVEMSVDYARVREQFGRPIGSVQAVKHRCADMAVQAEVARAATIHAAIAVRDEAEGRDFHVAVAKALCGRAFIQTAADNVQNHGGIGFTWECDAHLFVKRSRGFEVALGSSRHHLDALGTFFA